MTAYERDINSQARVQGSPLDMQEESGWATLRKAGLVTKYQQHIRHGAYCKIVTDKYAEVLFSDHSTAPAEEATPVTVERPGIDRGPCASLCWIPCARVR